MNDNGSWKEWSMFVLKTIEKLESKVDDLEKSLNDSKTVFNTEFTELKTKVTIYIVIAAFVCSTVVGFGSTFLLNKLNKDEQPTKEELTREIRQDLMKELRYNMAPPPATKQDGYRGQVQGPKE